MDAAGSDDRHSPPAGTAGTVGTGRVVATSLAVTVVATLPLFLTGALSVQMREELDFSVAALGFSLALYRISGALLATPLGRFADRVGPTASIRIAAVVAALTALGIAILAHGVVLLAVFLCAGGTASTLGQAGANLSLTRGVRQDRQGTAFGLKQSALPTAALIGGLTVPVFALTVGWRWAFLSAAVLAMLVALATPAGLSRSATMSNVTPNRVHSRRPLLVLSIAMFFAMVSASTLSAFTVDAAVTAGIGAAPAGLLLALGGVCAVAVRVVAGVLADRRGHGHFAVIAQMLTGGAVGYALLALGTPWGFVAGVVLSFGLGWGFNGLFWFAVLRLNQATPGSATGLVMPGGLLGGVVGPMVIGWIIETAGYSTAWSLAAACALAGAAIMLLGRRLIVADLAQG